MQFRGSNATQYDGRPDITVRSTSKQHLYVLPDVQLTAVKGVQT